MKSVHWILLLLMTLASTAMCSGPGVDQVRFRTLGPDQGLLQGSVSALLQDRLGFVWIGSQDGLTRYDGYRFRSFGHEFGDSESLVDNFVLALAQDADGMIWVATQAQSLSVFDPATERFQRVALLTDGAALGADEFVEKILSISGGRLLLSTRRAGLLMIDARSKNFLSVPFLQRERARALQELPDGEVLLAARSGVYVADASMQTIRPLVEFSEPTTVNDANLDSDGSWWLASTERGLIHVSAAGEVIQTYQANYENPQALSDRFCRKLLRDHLGRLWIATANGLNRLAEDGKTFSRWMSVAGDRSTLASNRLSTLMEDRNQQLWVGSWTGGPAIHDLRAEWLSLIHHVDSNALSIPSNIVGSLALDERGRIWAGLSDNMGLAQFDPNLGTVLHLRSSNSELPSDEVNVVRKALSGGFWVGAQRNDLARIDAQGRVIERVSFSTNPPTASIKSKNLPVVAATTSSVLSVHESRDGTLWIGMLNGGLNRRCPTCKSLEHFATDPTDPSSLPAETVTAIAEHSSGQMYFGFRRGGLARYLPESNRFQRFRHDESRLDSLSHNSVTTIAEDGIGRLWVGTQSGGINIMTSLGEDAFTIIGRARTGFPTVLSSESVSCLVFARDGYMWASLTGAIVRIDPKTLAVKNFGATDGVQGREFVSGSCDEGPDGRLYFGGLHGITVVAPNKLPSALEPPIAQVVEVQLGSQDLTRMTERPALGVFSADELRVSHRERWFGLGFGAMEFRMPQALRYRYRMQGFQEAWIETSSDRRFVPFSNLSAGEYLFEVQAAYPDAEFGPSRRLKVLVQQSPWLKPWAIAAYLALLIGLVASMIWPIRARWRERESARVLLEASDKQLRMVLAASGCELWRFDVFEQTLQRESVLGTYSETENTGFVPVAGLFEVIHPDDVEGFVAAMKSHVRGKAPLFEVTYRVRKGQLENYSWLRSSGKAETFEADGQVRIVSGTTIDVTELKTKEIALEVANDALNAQVLALEKARSQIIEIEKRRKLALWGSGCEFFEADLAHDVLVRENQVPNLAANEFGTDMRSYWQHLHPDDLSQFTSAFFSHVKGQLEFYDVTYRARRTDGGWSWIQTRGRTVAWDNDGRSAVIAGTNYDVSELKNAEIAIKHSAEELEHRVEQRTADLRRALDELRAAQRQLVESEKMAALGGLVAGVAHEINTPLGIGVTAASHLGEISQALTRKLQSNELRRTDLEDFSAQSQSAVALVMSNLRRASELVKSFKQVAVDQSSEQRRTIELDGYLQDILNSLRPEIKRHRHTIRLKADAGILWNSFPGSIYQIISNLVLNAISHAFVEQEHGEIQIIARATANEVTIFVSDNGCGMDSETAKRIFEPFFTTKRGQGGSGLGLHIVFNLVTKILGGTIKVETAPGEGTCFTISAPRTIQTEH